MKNTTILLAVAMVCGTVLTWGFFLWPTPYRYEKTTKSFGDRMSYNRIYRITRYTGDSELIVHDYDTE